MTDPPSAAARRRAFPVSGRAAAVVWLALLSALIGVFVLRQRAEIARMGGVLGDAAPGWLLGAAGIELLTLGLLGLQYQAVLDRLGHRLRWLPLVHAHLQRQVVGAVVPIGGPPSVYVFVRFLGRRGVPAARALFAVGLYSAAGYASVIVLLAPVVAWLQIERRASDFILFGSALLAGLFGLLMAALVPLLRGRDLPGWLGRRIPARGRALLDELRGQALGAADLAGPLGIAVGVKVANIALLWACLHAAGQPAAPAAVLAGYAVGTVCTALTPVFQGLGMVELSMAVALQGFGVPLEAALAATLLFRLFELWLPLTLGLAAYPIERRRAALDAPGHRARLRSRSRVPSGPVTTQPSAAAGD